MRERDIPRQLTIRGNEWTVRLVNKMPHGADDCVGLCVFDDREIYILRGQTPRERGATAWHEILHAIEWEYKVKIGHRIINRLEYAMLDVLAAS